MTASFVSTAIPYVNARPHVGFAYELVLADIIARHRRRRGHDVRFVTGTDDNSLKNVAAAEREGLSPRELVARNAAAFEALLTTLDVQADDFVRTSIDPRHRRAVEHLWCACTSDLYRTEWRGRYCAGCEAFVDDTVALCPEHGIAPEPVSEHNWFFRLSRWRAQLVDAIATGRLQILPDAARAETLAFLAGEVRDISVSRDAGRARGWGIPVPDDPSQVIYVWFDALANYVASLGLGSEDHALFDRYWRSGDTVHVIGKGITRFHAVYWPAFLLSAGLPLPGKLFVHGYLTVDGEKISKSRKNVAVDPIVERFGVDALRWYFARNCRTRADSDVTIDALGDVHDRDLVDRLGNLVQRCTSLAARLTDGRAPEPDTTPQAAALLDFADALPARVDDALGAFAPDEAAAAIIAVVDAANRYVDDAAPWRLARTDRLAAARVLHAPLVAARIAADELSPFVPRTSEVLRERIGDVRPGASLVIGPPPLARRSAVRT